MARPLNDLTATLVASYMNALWNRTFEEAVYFSFVTFTTVGFGDVVLTPGVRLLSGIEALNGIILVGWSTALLFAVVQRTMATLGRVDADG